MAKPVKRQTVSELKTILCVSVKIQFFSILILVVSCTSNQSEFIGVVSTEELLNEIIENMESESIHRKQINWDEFRKQVIIVADSSASDSSTTFYGYERSTLLAIRKALELLNDGHSFYRTTYGSDIRVSNRTCSQSFIDIPEVPDNIGYLKIDGFSGFRNEEILYSSRIQNKIKNQDRNGIIGWIIDLRGNTGGNMWPMIAGLGSLLGEGILGYFVHPDGNSIEWAYNQSSSWFNGKIMHELSKAPHELTNKNLPIAVLIDNRVTSSGEAVAISFKKRPNTKFFGTPTCGLSTANNGIPLQNGGMLFLTVAIMADRDKELYGDSIAPDVVIEDPSKVVEQAIKWLTSM